MQAEKMNNLFVQLQSEIESKGLRISKFDFNRPWGGFFVINEEQAQLFADIYFNGLDTQSIKISGKLSPKVLVVAPHQRLSWQYHYRRAEMWRVIQGEVAVVKSITDTEGECLNYKLGDLIILKQGERHRLIGLDDYGVVAEIWQHTDANNPSDEDDIVRLQDDYGR